MTWILTIYRGQPYMWPPTNFKYTAKLNKNNSIILQKVINPLKHNTAIGQNKRRNVQIT